MPYPKGIWLMLYFLEHTKNMNVYLRIAIAIVIGGVINSTIYYLGMFIINGHIENFWGVLLGSYIGKLYSIGLALLCYFICGSKYLVPTDKNVIHHHELER